METCRDIIRLAFRKLGLLRAGGEPTAAEAADGLASLSSFYFEKVNAGSFGAISSVIATEDTTARLNQHVNNTDPGTIVVTLPTTVDGWWYASVVPRDLAIVRTTDLSDTRATWIYDGQIQRWVQIDALTLNSEAPLSSRGADGLASVLAVRLAEMFGSEVLSPLTQRSANRYLLALVSRHGVTDEPYPCNPIYDYGFGPRCI